MFKEMLNASRPFELFVSTKLQEKGIASRLNHDERFDISASTSITYEVKTDANTYFSNNIGFEINYNDKPSGIYTTEADYFIFFLPFSCVTITVHTKVLYNLLNQKKHKTIKTGDRKASTMAFWKVPYFITECKKISEKLGKKFKIKKHEENDFPHYINENQIYKYLSKKYGRTKK